MQFESECFSLRAPPQYITEAILLKCTARNFKVAVKQSRFLNTLVGLRPTWGGKVIKLKLLFMAEC